MKLKNLLALLLALVLALSCCAGFAENASDKDVANALKSEEKAADDGEESQTQFFDDTLISSLDMTTSDWMLNGQTRALFAVLLMLEVSTCDDPEVVALMDDCSVPELYITSSINADLDAILVFYFLKEEQRLVQAMYVPLLGQFTASITEVTVDPELIMDALQAKGLFSDYQHISFTDYGEALNALSEAVNGN